MSQTSRFQRFSLYLVGQLHNDLLLRRLGLFLSVAAILSGIATYVVLTGSTPYADKSRHVLPLIYLDLTLMLLLAVIIAKRVVELWMERRRGLAGSKLHVQIAVLFAFVAIMPGIFVTVFSALFFNVGVQAWFSEPVRSALTEARVVAEAYLNDHSKMITHDAQEIAQQLSSKIATLVEIPEVLGNQLSVFSEERNLDEALIFDGNNNVIARAYLTFALEFEKVLVDAFEKARQGETVVVTSENSDRVRALIKIDDLTNTYLYIGKFVDPSVLHHVIETKSAIAQYNRLDAQRSGLQITFIVFFSVVALLLLFVAIWAGLTVANLFVRPIGRLIVAADSVSKGQFNITVPSEGSLNNELGALTQSFNHMILQLDSQRRDLVSASVQIDHRRQFMETILARISAGVVSIDDQLAITLVNRRARELIDNLAETEQGASLKVLVPEFTVLLENNTLDEEPLVAQVTLMRSGMTRILQTVIVKDQSTRTGAGYIITFDDVTPLLLAQRKAAWSDVARKIAHEIKNPLTPIQLSAERLKRKYLREITSDPVTFNACVDTIVRQVGQIGKLVSEFSAFARMPEPVMRSENIVELCKQAAFLQKQAYSQIEIKLDLQESEIKIECDATQIGQVLTNLLQNAINALLLPELNGGMVKNPKILIKAWTYYKRCRISIEDNGPGFPVNGRERLTEPYYTTHSKGTGLGLAIVAKIVEDHRGKLELGDSVLGGAKVTMEFELSNKQIGV